MENNETNSGFSNQTADIEYLLQEANDRKAMDLIPVMIFLAMLMFIGVIGNALVCYFYARKCTPTSNTIFIIAVAVFDMVLCTISIPVEILDMRLFYMFTATAACKIGRFFNTFCATGSALTLLVIAVDRYRKICRPFKTQFGLKEAKVSVVCVMILAIFLSWPAALIFSSVSVEIVTANGVTLHGHDCTTNRDKSYKLYIMIYNGVLALAFISSSITFVVMYSRIGFVIYKKHIKLLTIPQEQNHGGTTREPKTSQSLELSDQPSNERTNASLNGVNSESQHRRKSVVDVLKNRKAFGVKTLKYTRMMFVITLVYILSFLPYLILSIWRAFQKVYEGETMTGAALAAFNLGLRSYFINSAVNPLIYGFFNPRFRHYFLRRFCFCCIKITETSLFYSTDRSHSTQ